MRDAQGFSTFLLTQAESQVKKGVPKENFSAVLLTEIDPE